MSGWGGDAKTGFKSFGAGRPGGAEAIGAVEPVSTDGLDFIGTVGFSEDSFSIDNKP